MYVDGTALVAGDTHQIGSQSMPDITYTTTSWPERSGLRLGSTIYSINAYDLDGNIDEFRVSKGIARWTADFTPPTEEYGGTADITPQIRFNKTNNYWELSNDGTAWKRIPVVGQSDVGEQSLFQTVAGDSGSTTADSPTDTLTFVGGTGITTAVTDNTVTINASGVNIKTFLCNYYLWDNTKFDTGNVHFELQIDNNADFSSPSIDLDTSTSQTNWLMNTGSAWVAFDSGGMATAYIQASYIGLSITAETVLYIRWRSKQDANYGDWILEELP